jgi:hypothetical protein
VNEEEEEMFLYRGLQPVTKGSYWSAIDGRRVIMRRDGMLPGDGDARYLKMSPLGLFIIGPLFGATFVTFMPLLGIGVFFIVCLVPLIGTLGSVAVAGARVCCSIASGRTSVSWTPTRASFAGVRNRKRAVRGNASDGRSATAEPPGHEGAEAFSRIPLD